MDLQWWREFGKCKPLPKEQIDQIFFVGRGGSAKRAKQFCSTCPVRSACLDYAILYDERGIWAGTTDAERRDLSYLKDLIRQRAIEEGTLESRIALEVVPQVQVTVVAQTVPIQSLDSFLVELQSVSSELSSAIQALQS